MKGKFWGSVLVTSIAFALLVGFLMPYTALGAETAADRNRVLLLTLWTSGVMCICFGGAGLLSAVTPLGFREVAEVGSVSAAVEARREARSRGGSERFYNFAGWLVSAGGCLVGIYFLVWLFTR